MRLHCRGVSGLAWLLILALVVPLLLACDRPGPGPAVPTPTSAAVAASDTPVTEATTAPTAAPSRAATPSAAAAPSPTPVDPATLNTTLKQAVSKYVDAWQGGRYAEMYTQLSSSAKSSIPQDKFVGRYQAITEGIEQIGVVVTPSIPANAEPSGTPPTINVPFHVTYRLAVLGEIEADNILPLVYEDQAWKVAWTSALIFKDLTGDRVVRYDPVNTQRGSILDRHGKVLAEDGIILTVGVVPGEIKDEAELLKTLGDTLKMPPDAIKKLYATAQPDWFVPIKDVPAADKATVEQKLGGLLGVSLRNKRQRVYPYGPTTAQVVGYVSPIQDSEIASLRAKGYDRGDMIGRAGLEAAYDRELAGQKGATLTIAESAGPIVKVIAQKPATPGQTIVTTLDVNYQAEAVKTLGSHPGSLILMDPRDNSLLALASTPTYDPNLFVLGMTDAQWQEMNGPARPMLFRPVQGQYAPGSIFKPITMAAGLEKGGFKTTDTFDCGLDWKGLPGVVLHNWKAQGTLNLIQSLTGSCDPTFYTIGLKLSQLDPTILPTMSRAFGLGQPTGLAAITEQAGIVPDPDWKLKEIHQPWYDGDGVNLAIGQGYLLTTPLQMANVYSTIANHGKIRAPLLVREIKGPDGAVIQSFEAEPKGTIPVSARNLDAIVQGLKSVANTPLGTAYYAWKGSKIPMAAKTGSAENETSKAHAWFVGYTSPEQPTVLALVMLEGGEWGGEFAAPLGRKIIEYAVTHPE